MKTNIKNAIETYQCSGCVHGHDIKCFERYSTGVGCGKHSAGTYSSLIGLVFLGMPKGFNRLGNESNMIPRIYESHNLNYDLFNVPVWKYLSKDGHTFVRCISPRINVTYIDVYLEDCIDKINCLEITEKELELMD